jgi:hypothetical protein
VRTLVIGIPLPHVTFDNYSFISAPALSEYEQMIVDTAAVSNAVEAIATGSAEHRTFAGQPVSAGPSTATSFGLGELLKMRRREAEWFFAKGGVAICFAHPDVHHPAVGDKCDWRRYSWLPAPSEFSYERHLLPGFGAPGVELSDDTHPLAPFIAEFSERLAYRATIDESAPDFAQYGRVFARNRAGVPIGADLTIEAGRMVLVPPLLDARAERVLVAQRLRDCLERLQPPSVGA